MLGAMGWFMGCSASSQEDLTDPSFARNAGGSGSSTAVGGTTSSTITGMDPGCLGAVVEGLSADDATRLISDKCGVFVQSGSTSPTEEGTQAAPYHTLQKALDNAGNKRVYACSSVMTPFAEAVTVAAPVEVYGNFECDKGWVFKAATRSVITGAAQNVSLTLTSLADGALIEGFKIFSASATGTSGESSVAVAVAAIDATLAECDVEAGDGAAGENGAAPAGPPTDGINASLPDSTANSACINPASLAGGTAGSRDCNDGVTAGGKGGKGGVTGINSGDGASGANGTPVHAVSGAGGPGQDAVSGCVPGAAGIAGSSGVVGAAGALPGNLSLSGPASTDGVDGADGTRGSRGQGGGGGGGVKAGNFCPPGGSDGNGASGGGGGSGGCGGKGGGAGKAGGSSIAIVSLGIKLKLISVTLKSGKGGVGGAGTAGQAGGAPGLGMSGGAPSAIAGSKQGCSGGSGGAGGTGGPGGGGRGGHSIGLASLGTPTAKPSSFTPGLPGNGGIAGTGGSPMGDGAKGLGGSATAACWDFSKNMTCAK